MTRRGGPGVQALAVAAVLGLCFYGMYSHHQVSSKLKRSEEKSDNLKQQHDSLAAQLQGDHAPSKGCRRERETGLIMCRECLV